MKETAFSFNMDISDFMVKNGSFLMLPTPMLAFMGIDNATMLMGLLSHYKNLLRQRKTKNKTFYFSSSQLKKKTGLTLHRQNTALNKLSTCQLIKVIGKTFRKLQSRRRYPLFQPMLRCVVLQA